MAVGVRIGQSRRTTCSGKNSRHGDRIKEPCFKGTDELLFFTVSPEEEEEEEDMDREPTAAAGTARMSEVWSSAGMI
jgi:hypothetical protein